MRRKTTASALRYRSPCRHLAMLVVTVVVTVIALTWSSRSLAIEYGINYDVVDANTARTSDCKSDPNAAVHQKFVLARYINAPMRAAAQEQLKALRRSGFTSVRSIAEIFPCPHPTGDLINTKKIDDTVTSSIHHYVQDVKDAGFAELILAFGTQGTANPACRKKEWGDCFDPATVSASVAAEEALIRAAHSVNGISLRLDLLNEACISKSVPQLVNDNFTQLIGAAVKMHAANFATIPATVSCQLERTGDGLAALSRLFIQDGDKIGFFDIHAYPAAQRKEPAILQEAARSLTGQTAPVIIGETTYADPDYRSWIAQSYRTAFHRDPPQIIFWPLHATGSGCSFDVALPYSLKDAMGESRQ